MPILPAFHGKALSRKISITVPHNIEKCCIPWKQIAGMRDKLVHDYRQVDIDIIWEVTQEVVMNHFVSHSSNFLPRDMRVLLFEFWRDLFRSFTNNFYGMSNSKYRFLIGFKGVKIKTYDKNFGSIDGFQDIS
ncbi:MAG: DUF86 domain-containing protein [Roseofilum sp. SBFL]|nr:DUF86 domain-containing protein [Roseofilum sp. SID3]MBP0024710.1 DUF86 domain-containing protein [Roseofilum sp. SID2]MBP0039517.1 DUF86 domain-containing protein [Roseofilum sp. SID1]MBP0042543.1 DUF86 domain-containing protein [Roseofilum sp. SBFL]